eukprot:755815-Hanusia_phi.AAC.11
MQGLGDTAGGRGRGKDGGSRWLIASSCTSPLVTSRNLERKASPPCNQVSWVFGQIQHQPRFV